jgi:hypothetical protein
VHGYPVLLIGGSVVGLGVMGAFSDSDAFMSFFRDYYPHLIVVLAMAKLALGGGLLLRLVEAGEVKPNSLAVMGAVWLAAAALLYGLLSAVIPSAALSRVHLVLLAILLLPLARLAAAPLSLNWNRHR